MKPTEQSGPMKPFNNPIRCGDCREVMRGCQRPGTIRLCVADPPYNIGLGYPGYDDAQTPDAFLGMLEEAFAEVRRLMTDDGSLFVFMGVKLQAEVLLRLKGQGYHHLDTIVWHHTFGQSQRTKFTSSWVAIHQMVVDPKAYVFHADEIRVPSARQLLYADKRANPKGKVPDNTWVLVPETQAPGAFAPGGNVWKESRVCGSFKERVPHVTQLPAALVERIVRAASDPGDIVLDPFAGAGTVPLVADRLGRRGLGIELCPETADLARERILADRSARGVG